MVGLYETAVDELSTFGIGEKNVRPKVIASTATVRKAKEQMNNVFMRNVSIFPPSGLDVEDNFFSVQRSTKEFPGRRISWSVFSWEFKASHIDQGLCDLLDCRTGTIQYLRSYRRSIHDHRWLFQFFKGIRGDEPSH